MRPPCSLVLACAVVLAAVDARAADGESGNVRGLEPTAVKMLRAARAGSPTFRALLQRLEQSDLVVYVRFEPRTERPPALTSVVGAAGSRRFVLVRITTRAPDADRFLLLGHELRHAVELADAPEVRDEAGMQVLYERIGSRKRPKVYETADAVAAGHAVRREMFDAARRIRPDTAVAAIPRVAPPRFPR